MNAVPLGRLVDVVGGATPSKLNARFWDGAIPWVSPKDMKRDVISDATDHVSELALQGSALRRVPAGAVLLVVRGMILAHTVPVARLAKPATINQDMKALLPRREIDGGYLLWALKSAQRDLLGLVEEAGHGTRCLRTELWRGHEVPTHPIAIQRAIAVFLDRKTAAIDALIEKKERLLALLAEKRASLLHHAVTKGLDPDVPMKDSGVPWIGEIPAHWDVHTLKRLVATRITDGPHETPEFVESGVPFLSATAVHDGRLHFDRRRGEIARNLHEQYCRKCRPQRDDLLLVKSGATTGKLAIVETDAAFSVWSPLALIRCRSDRIHPRFLFHSLGSESVQRQIQTSWTYGTQPNIGMGVLENLMVAVPPIEEQRKIFAVLQHHGGAEERAARLTVSSIAHLREYRQALITAAVTGQIDVTKENAA